MPTIDPNVIDYFSRFIAVIIVLSISLFLVWLVTIIDIVKSDFKRDAQVQL
jgi:hypothetical protein